MLILNENVVYANGVKLLDMKMRWSMNTFFLCLHNLHLSICSSRNALHITENISIGQ